MIQTARIFSRSDARTGKTRLDAPPCLDVPPRPVGTGVSVLTSVLPSRLPFPAFTGHPITALVPREIRPARRSHGVMAVDPRDIWCGLRRVRSATPRRVVVGEAHHGDRHLQADEG